MSFLDLAVPLQLGAVTFFVGSGFSKHLTNDSAPSWLDLLAELTKKIDDFEQSLIKKLFEIDDQGDVCKCRYDLSICAEILEAEYRYKNKSIKTAAVNILKEKINQKTINRTKTDKLQSFFSKHRNVNFVTTNYDTLISEYIFPEHGRDILKDSPIPKSRGGNIYHIHGCISRPSSLLLTLSDYYAFLHKDSYLSRKFFTLLQETTVVILGYALADFNLNSIFNEAKNSKNMSVGKSDIYFVTKNKVDDMMKRFYASTYGIHVIDDCPIDCFFEKLEASEKKAIEIRGEIENLSAVLKKEKEYSDDFLRLRGSLTQIIIQANVIGVSVSLSNKKFTELIFYILEKRKGFTKGDGAWEQYLYLAEDLIEAGSTFDMTKIAFIDFKSTFLKLIDYSFSTMSKGKYFGYSWAAFSAWKMGFKNLRPENQTLIKEYCLDRFESDADVKEVVFGT